jgi:hypothetical protein
MDVVHSGAPAGYALEYIVCGGRYEMFSHGSGRAFLVDVVRYPEAPLPSD